MSRKKLIFIAASILLFYAIGCGQPAKDAHHIIERRLFTNGGYYLENGASLCEEHHIKAEETTLSCDEIREKAGGNYKSLF